jgi:glycosyltransferase involved in cell wall biosynthesis
VRPNPRVLLLTQFYPPEPCAAANRATSLATSLREAGFAVDVVTGAPTFPAGIKAPEDRGLLPRTTWRDGIRLARVWTYASPKLSGRNRLLNWLSVAVASSVYVAAVGRRYDVVLVTTPPITLALPAFTAVLRHRARLVVDVRDVFPDVAIKMGAWSADGAPARIVGFVARTLYRAARLVVCVTESARDEVVARGSDPNKTIVGPNGFDAIEPAPASPYARKPGEFVVAFVGNMGLATGLDVIVDAASLLRDEPGVRFVLAGGGADAARLARRCAAEGLDNVTMIGVVPRPEANALLRDADACVVPLKRNIVDSLPTKLFDALALGCPVICCADGEAKQFVERSQGGVATAPEDGAALADAVRTLRADPARSAALAANGRAYVEEHYDRARIMRRVAATVAGIP